MEDIKLVIDEESCRICRSSEGGQILIFGLSGAERNIPTKIRECLPIKVSEKDGLPKTICADCAEKLDDFFAFRDECRKIDSNLREIYQTGNKSDSDCSNSKTSDISKEKGGTLSIDTQSSATPKTHQASLAEPLPEDYVLMKEETFHVDNTAKTSNIMADYLIEFNNNTKVKGEGEIQDMDILNAMRKRREVLPPMWDVFERTVMEGEKPIEVKLGKGGKQGGRPLLKGRFSVTHRRYIVAKGAFPCSLCGRCFLFNQGRPREGISFADADILPGDVDPVTESPTDGLYPCPQCGKLFPHKGALKRHQQTHFDGKKFICKFCGKAFNRNEHLTRHMLSHTGGRPFQCDLCSKVFTRKEHLMRHKQNHLAAAASGAAVVKEDLDDGVGPAESAGSAGSGYGYGEYEPYEVKPFVCDICHGAYARREQMSKHKKIAHGIDTDPESEPKPYCCNHCLKTFTRKEHLTRHKKIHVRQAFSGNFELSEGVSPTALAVPRKTPKKEVLIPLTVNSSLGKVGSKSGKLGSPQVSVVKPLGMNKDTVTLEISAGDEGVRPRPADLMDSILKNGKYGEISIMKADRGASGGEGASTDGQDYEEGYYETTKTLTEEEKAQLEGFLADTSFAGSDFLSVSYDSDRRDPDDEYVVEKDSIDLEDLKKMPKCRICAKAFTKRNHLHRHLKRYHSLSKAQVISGKFEIFENGGAEMLDEVDLDDDDGSPVSKRPKGIFPCSVCRKTFSRKYHMYRHQKTQHGIDFPTKESRMGEDPLRCMACGYTFATLDELHKHDCVGGDEEDDDEDRPQRKPRNTFKCAICKNTFENHDGFKDHKCKKGHKCTTCGETFDKARHLNRHMQEKHVPTGEAEPEVAPI